MNYATIDDVPEGEILSWYEKFFQDEMSLRNKEERREIIGEVLGALAFPQNAHNFVGDWGHFDDSRGTTDYKGDVEQWAYDALEALGVVGFAYRNFLNRAWSRAIVASPGRDESELHLFAKACGLTKADLARGARVLAGKEAP